MFVNVYLLLLNIILFRHSRYAENRDTINITLFIPQDKQVTYEIRHQSDMKKDYFFKKQIEIGNKKLEYIFAVAIFLI